jgi:hypothetical protein
MLRSFIVQSASHPNLVLEIHDAFSPPTIRVDSFTGSPKQQWRFSHAAHAIISVSTGLILDTDHSKHLRSGSAVVARDFSFGRGQHWDYDASTRWVRSGFRNLVFTVKDSDVPQGSDVIISRPNGSPSQDKLADTSLSM